MADPAEMIAFQGAHGAYSDMAARALFPENPSLPCESFAAAFAAVRDGRAGRAVIPVDNTLAGRVADVHMLLPAGGLSVTGEYFLPVRHCLMAPRGARLDDVKNVWSHTHALPQCRKIIAQIGAAACVHADTAGAAAFVAEKNDPAHAAIAGKLAAELYGLDILQEDVQDADHNYTRFIVLARAPEIPAFDPARSYICSLVFTVKNIPAALYKALGCFAMMGINLGKLESYQDEQFHAARFFAEVEGHPQDPRMQTALAELQASVAEMRVLGAYEAHGFRNLHNAG